MKKMNNSHFAICNQDIQAFAVVKRVRRNIDEISEAIKIAIEDETGDEVESVILEINLDNVTTEGSFFTAIIDGEEFTYYMFPVWEY